MFVIENRISAGDPNNDFQTSHTIAGNPQEIQLAAAQLTSLAYAAIAEGKMNIGRIDGLQQNIDRTKGPITIFSQNAPTFLRLVTTAGDLAVARRRHLDEAGVEGRLDVIAIRRELAILNCYGGGPFYPNDVNFCTEDGFALSPNPVTKSLDMTVDDLPRAFGEGLLRPWEVKMVERLGSVVTHTVDQFNLPDKIQANTELPKVADTTVGTLNASGAYVPYAKILDSGPVLF